MTSVDELFKKPYLPSKRKLEPTRDPNEIYKAVKTEANGNTRGSKSATVEDEAGEDDSAGPELPPDFDVEDIPDDEEGRFFGGGVTQDTTKALDIIDEREQGVSGPEKVDSAWLRRTALNFEKKISKNAELRAKYEDDPQKFMASEADLDVDIKALSVLSEHPSLYKDFAELGCVGSLVSLLSHENTDIAIDAVEIIAELTDEDIEAEQDQWDVLVDAMLDSDVVELLAQNLTRLDEDNNADRAGVYHILNVLENLTSQPSVAEKIGQSSDIIPWLHDRIRRKEGRVSQNKQYAAEILAILMQSSPKNRSRLIEVDGVDTLLQLLSAYRKRDPEKDSDEEEYVENIFACLTLLVEEDAGKDKFIAGEGVELALIMLREGKMSKPRALRVLNHALGGNTGRGACERLVEAAGLKVVFGMFMKKPDHQAVEHLLGIFASLLRLLPGESAPRIRTMAKFMEKDYEKISKIIQFRREYASRLSVVDQSIAEERSTLDGSEQEVIAGEWLSRRLDAGLFSLQTIDVILAWLIAEDDGAKSKIKALLSDQDQDLNVIKATLQEQLAGLEDSSSDDQDAKDMLGTLIQFV